MPTMTTVSPALKPSLPSVASVTVVPDSVALTIATAPPLTVTPVTKGPALTDSEVIPAGPYAYVVDVFSLVEPVP